MTLVEVLAGLIILSIVALVSLRYLGTGLTSSGNAVTYVKDLENVGTVINRMTVQYNALLKTDSTPLATLKNSIGSTGSTQSNGFGSYQVVQNDYITFNASQAEVADSVLLTILKVKIRVGGKQLTALYTF
jgi:type II secretory pathway pseudopilin PulG